METFVVAFARNGTEFAPTHQQVGQLVVGRCRGAAAHACRQPFELQLAAAFALLLGRFSAGEEVEFDQHVARDRFVAGCEGIPGKSGFQAASEHIGGDIGRRRDAPALAQRIRRCCGRFGVAADRIACEPGIEARLPQLTLAAGLAVAQQRLRGTEAVRQPIVADAQGIPRSLQTRDGAAVDLVLCGGLRFEFGA